MESVADYFWNTQTETTTSQKCAKNNLRYRESPWMAEEERDSDPSANSTCSFHAREPEG